MPRIINGQKIFPYRDTHWISDERHASCLLGFKAHSPRRNIAPHPLIQNVQAPRAGPGGAPTGKIRPYLAGKVSGDVRAKGGRPVCKALSDAATKRTAKPIFPRKGEGPLGLVYNFGGQQIVEGGKK